MNEESRLEILEQLINHFVDYVESNRQTKRPFYPFKAVTFLTGPRTDDGEELGTLEFHRALQWMHDGVYYSDEIDLTHAEAIEIDL